EQRFGSQVWKPMESRSGSAFSVIQTKLEISQPDDIYEQEANHVAEEVMRIPDPALRNTDIAKIDEAKIQRKENPDNANVFPSINLEFMANLGQKQRCCTCGTPPCVSHLGSAVVGDNTAQNGMNLVATILHTIASSARLLDYGFVQVVQSRQCLE